jgi:hypothetical protein
MIGLRHPQAGVSRQAGLPFSGLLRLVQGFGAEARQDRFDDRGVSNTACETVRGSIHGETMIAGTRTPYTPNISGSSSAA